MPTLKEIAYNCRQATFLAEKKQVQGINLVERLQLRFHLTGCSVCRIYQQQSIQISKAVRDHFANFNDPKFVLSGEFKNQLQQTIAGRLKG